MKKYFLPILFSVLILRPLPLSGPVSGGDIVTGSVLPVVSEALAAAKPADSAPTAADIPKTIEVWVTAYSSSPDETKEEDQVITASNTLVHDGVLAANFLPFGTKVKIPELFGDKIFIVEDRMNRRKTNFVDIWMSSKEKALDFGIHLTDVEVVKMGIIPNPLPVASVAKASEENPATD